MYRLPYQVSACVILLEQLNLVSQIYLGLGGAYALNLYCSPHIFYRLSSKTDFNFPQCSTFPSEIEQEMLNIKVKKYVVHFSREATSI